MTHRKNEATEQGENTEDPVTKSRTFPYTTEGPCTLVEERGQTFLCAAEGKGLRASGDTEDPTKSSGPVTVLLLGVRKTCRSGDLRGWYLGTPPDQTSRRRTLDVKFFATD